MFKKYLSISALACAFIAMGAQAAEKNNEAIKKQLSQFDIEIEEIQPSPLPGIFEVQTDNGILYTNKDASYFLYGKLFATKDNNLIDLTAKTQAKKNAALLAQANVKNELISYPAKNEKYVINVFTDTTCGYCVKLHSEMKKYNDLGITVNYLAFPRGGHQASNLGQMSAIWCAKDKNKAMDLAKDGKFKESNNQCINTVRKHYELGNKIGISGTPAILLANGVLISGYLPPAQMLETLKQQG